jgi:hypothetical protein
LEFLPAGLTQHPGQVVDRLILRGAQILKSIPARHDFHRTTSLLYFIGGSG